MPGFRCLRRSRRRPRGLDRFRSQDASGIWTLRILDSDGMNRAVVGDLAEFFTQQRAAFWNDPAYVDTVNDAVNLEGSLLALGHTVQPFTGTSSAAFSAALANADVVVIPDAGSQQRAQHTPSFTSSDNHLEWSLEVRIDIPGPDWVETRKLRMVPA